MPRERITAVITTKGSGAEESEKYFIAVTKRGTIKKTALSEFNTNRKTGLIAISLKDGDELVSVKETSGSDNVLIITKNGKCICFSENDGKTYGKKRRQA